MQRKEIILLKEELIHDIQRNITKIERLRKLEEPILTDDETDRYELASTINDALGLAANEMQAYMMLPSTFAHHITTNHTEDWAERSIVLGMPDNWPTHLIDTLTSAVKNYIVKKTEFLLLAEALPDDKYTVACGAFADTRLNEITSILSARLGGVRIHPTIFG